MVFTVNVTFQSVSCLNKYQSYYVNRDTLFCYHKASEAFLQRLMSLYVASHYKVIYYLMLTIFSRVLLSQKINKYK